MRAEPWPWIVAGTLATAIGVSVSFALVAVSNPDPLVVDDVQAAERDWNARHAERERAAADDWRLVLTTRPEGDGLRVRVDATDRSGAPLDAALALRRVRPSEGGLDAEFALDADGGAHVPLPRPGRWHLVASARRDGALLEQVWRVDR